MYTEKCSKNDIVKKTVYHELAKKVNAIQTMKTCYLVIKADDDLKIKDIEDRIPFHSVYFTANDFNKSSSTIFDERLKRAKLDKNKDLGTVEQSVNKNKEKKFNLKYLQTFDLSYFLGENFLVMINFKICLFMKQHLAHWM